MVMSQPTEIPIHTPAPQHRLRRFAYAMGAGMVSKVLATIVQLAALPIALHALGTERYAAFLTLQAFLAWTGLFGFGIVPSLPRFISKAYVTGDKKEEENLFQSATLFIGMMAAALLCILIAFSAFISPQSLIAGHKLSASEINLAYYIVITMQGLQLFASLMPAFRSGYQELHYSYIWSSFANLLVMGLLITLSRGQPSLTIFFTALYGPILGVMFFDAALMMWQRPYLMGKHATIIPTIKKLVPHATNVLAMQLSYSILASFPIVLIAHLSGSTATAGFGSLMQLLILGNSGMNLVFQPLVPAIANAYAHDDAQWIQRAYVRAAMVVGAVCSVVLIAAIAAGPELMHLWLGKDLGITRTLTTLMGLYFALLMSSLFHFNVLAATGELLGIGKVYVTEGVLSITLGSALAYFYGVEGMAGGLVLATLCATSWYMPMRMWKLLRRIRDHGTN